MQGAGTTVEAARRAMASGMPQEAERLLRSVLAVSPRDTGAVRGLADVLRRTNRAAEAAQLLGRAAQTSPSDASLRGDLGLALLDLGQFDAAAAHLEAVVAALPRSAVGYLYLGQAYLAANKNQKAVEVFKRGLGVSPGNLHLEACLGRAYTQDGSRDLAVPLLERSLARVPEGAEWAEIAATLATAYQFEDRFEDAIAVLRRLRAVSPKYIASVHNEAMIYDNLNRQEEADRLLEEALAQYGPRPEFAFLIARAAEKRGDLGEACAVLEKSLASPDLPGQLLSNVYFKLGGYREKLTKYPEAFEAYRRAHEAVRTAWSPEQFARGVDEVIACFTRENLARLPRAAQTAQTDRPVFILGMPRSGTSLVEQILSCHPRLFGAGELVRIARLSLELARSTRSIAAGAVGPGVTAQVIQKASDDYIGHLTGIAAKAGRGDAARLTDKMPQNFSCIGLIALLVPGARIIHCTRDALDNCLSCWSTGFLNPMAWAGDFDHLASFYAQYRRLMKHWKSVEKELGVSILDLPYEQITAEQETWSRAIVGHAGLEWDDACLRFHESTRITKTASMDQVKKPMYRTSVARAARFGELLDPLRAALRRHLPEESLQDDDAAAAPTRSGT